MALQEVTFPSFNKRDTVYGWIYYPVDEPVGIVQVMHGFGEHSRRYLHMIQALTGAGFIMAADDHVGHGKTAQMNHTSMDTGETGWETYIYDERSLTDIVRKDHADLPFFVFGHSWGSMIARAYAAKYASELAGLMLCGVVEQTPGISADMISEVEATVNADNGEKAIGLDAPLFRAFASWNYRYGEGVHPNSWIASYLPVVLDHAGDPMNNPGATVSGRFELDFCKLYQFVASDDYAEKLPVDLPVLIVGGDQDPAGNFGEGTYHLANLMWKHGMRDVRTKLYPGLRHEVHNEPESREDVEHELVTFLEGHLPNAEA